MAAPVPTYIGPETMNPVTVRLQAKYPGGSATAPRHSSTALRLLAAEKYVAGAKLLARGPDAVRQDAWATGALAQLVDAMLLDPKAVGVHRDMLLDSQPVMVAECRARGAPERLLSVSMDVSAIVAAYREGEGGWARAAPIADYVVRREVFAAVVTGHTNSRAEAATRYQAAADTIEKVVAKLGPAPPEVFSLSPSFLAAVQGHLCGQLVNSSINNDGNKVLGTAAAVAKEVIALTTGSLAPHLLEDPTMVAWRFIPRSEAYTALAFGYVRRAFRATSRLPGGKYSFSDMESFLKAADSYLLASACLPDDNSFKAHHAWKAADMYLHAGGVPYGLIRELADLATRYEPMSLEPRSLSPVNTHLKALLRRIGPVTDSNKDKANRPVLHQQAETVVPMELHPIDAARGLSGTPRPDAELRTLLAGLEDLRKGFAAVVARESESETGAAGIQADADVSDDSATKRRLIHCAKCKRISDSKTEFQRCSRCRSTHYCSAQCQKDDWKSHKFLCTMKVDPDKPDGSVFVRRTDEG